MRSSPVAEIAVRSVGYQSKPAPQLALLSPLIED
jgi:hypothetical protein